jgi:hypothetical protein
VPAAVVCTGIGFVLALGCAPAEGGSLCLRTVQITSALLLGTLTGAVAGVQLIQERHRHDSSRADSAYAELNPVCRHPV